MIIISARNVKEIQQEGDWFIFLLEDDYGGGARDELRESLPAFIEDIGRKNWVVEGLYNEKREFITAVTNEYKLYLIGHYDLKRFPTPALLITNGLPHKSDLDDLVRIIVPLQNFYEKPGDTGNFLMNLAVTLQEPDAAQRLKVFDKERVKTLWGWIAQYAPKGIIALGVTADAIAVLGFLVG